jgi:hypothetical protein
LIDKEVDCPEGKALLVSDDPFRDFNKINTHFTRIYNLQKNFMMLKLEKEQNSSFCSNRKQCEDWEKYFDFP